MTASSALLRSFLNESFATVGCFTIEEDNATTMSLEMAMSYNSPNMKFSCGRTKQQQTRSSRKRRIAGRRQKMDPMPAFTSSDAGGSSVSRWESSPQKNSVARATIESSPSRLSPPRRPLRRNSSDLTPPQKPMRRGTIESPLMPQAPASLDDDGDDEVSQ